MVTKVDKKDDGEVKKDHQNDGLAGLIVEASAIESVASDADSVGGAAASEPANSNARELEQAAQIIRAMALPLMPEFQREKLAVVWSDSVIKQASEAGAAVMDLHGLKMGDVMGKYAPYIALAAALAPPVLATVKIVKQPAVIESAPQNEQSK